MASRKYFLQAARNQWRHRTPITVNGTRRNPYSTATQPPAVRILEVGPRDGLQNIKEIVPTSTKLDLIRRLAATGLKHIETTSFVSSKWIPQLADNRQVYLETRKMLAGQNIHTPVLVPNMKGFEAAAEVDAEEVVIFASASEGFSWKNTNCSVDEALVRCEAVARAALSKGMRVRGVISCVIGCPYDGPTEPSKVLAIARRLLAMGCYEVGLGDTVGVGTPTTIEKLLRVLLSEIPPSQLAGHYHDTYGQAVGNVMKSFDMGLSAFDASVAGLGGCPHAKGAKGNVSTEDVIYALQGAGLETGVDLQMLAEVGDWISKTLRLPNASRAGAALAAKAQPDKSVQTPVIDEKPTAQDWDLIQDHGDFKISRAGHVLKITLTRPKMGNAMTSAMLQGVTRAFLDSAQDRSIFHIVLEAEGKYFCTGMDLSTSGSTTSPDAHTKRAYYRQVVDLFDAIERAPQTTIAAVNGPCFGGGVGLAFACDIRIASEKARFTMTEIRLGLTPAIISKLLVREWGVSFLREAMLTGREVDVKELQRIGAVHSVVEGVEELTRATEEYLERLSKCAPRSAEACKDLIRLGWTSPGSDVLDAKIEKTFAAMMEPGSEGEHGLEQFRNKVKGVDWAQFWRERAAKL